MKLVTKQGKVKDAIQSFFNIYPQYHAAGAPFYTEERYNRMLTLVPNTCTVEQFNEALGVTHWTDNLCDECEQNFDTLVQIGQEPDYERYLCLCAGCLEEAASMLK